jgi:hypothetical protein
MDEVIVGQFAMDPSWFFIHVDDGMVALQGKVERRSLIPFLVRAVHAVEGVVQVENRLIFDVDDRTPGWRWPIPGCTTERTSNETLRCDAGYGT